MRPQPFLAATAGFRAGADTPRAFLERCLEAVDRLEPVIGAFVSTSVADARIAADASTQRWHTGRPLSPLDGMPVGIKDIIETEDMPTGMGSPLFDGWRSERDAASVKALREAGAVILAKTATTEFATLPPCGTRNPHDPTRTPGGSSSGSAAAVAAGMLSAALGTQVVGSIIRPASYCGCIGFKPTVGALNRSGSHDFLSQSCLGVLAADLADAWQVAREISVRAGGDPGQQPLSGPAEAPPAGMPRRLAVLETGGWKHACAAAKQGFSRVTARLRDGGVELIDRHGNPEVAALDHALADAADLGRRIITYESRWPLNTYRDRDATKLSKFLLDRLAEAERMSPEDYAAGLAARERVRAMYHKLAAVCDGALTLSAPDCAPVGLHSTGDPVFAVPASLLGVPALSLPVLTADDLPLGLQIMGFSHGDAGLFAVARWLLATTAVVVPAEAGTHQAACSLTNGPRLSPG